MKKNIQPNAKNDNPGTVQDIALISLMNDFELIAQAASHDLKDPLRQAVIDIEALISTYTGKPLDAAAQGNMTMAIEAISLVIKRIELLRSYSRLVQNKKAFQDVDCNKAVQNALANLQPTIESRKAHIHCDALPTVFGSEEQLTMLFQAIIDNSIRFCPNKTPEIRISAREMGNMWELSFKDNGIGLDPVYREFIYAIFQRLDKESPHSSDGVGLTFGKKIIQNHSGSIRYESDGENGTCFFVSLPKR